MITQEFIKQNFPKGKLTLIGGRFAMGKTSLLTSLALSLAHENQKSLYFSIEMSKKALDARFKKICKSKDKGLINKVYIDDTPFIKLDQIRELIDSLCVDYVFVDYIQLIHTDIQDRNEELNYIVNALKSMAKEFNLPIIAASQLNRRIDNTEIRPKIDDLYWIKPDSLDNVNLLMLHANELFPYVKRIEEKAELIRYAEGKELSLSLFFNAETAEFSEWLNWERLKEEILGSSRWIVSIDQYDLVSFEGENSKDIKIIETATTNTSDDRFDCLVHSLQERMIIINHAVKKLFVFIQFPLSVPVTMEEMRKVNKLVEFFVYGSEDCEVMWTMSPSDDNITRITCAIKY